MPKIYFCTNDYLIAETLGCFENIVYETTLDEWLKLTKKIFNNPEDYMNTETASRDIPLHFSADRNLIYRTCEALFTPIEDTYPITETVALTDAINENKGKEGGNHTLKVA